MAVTLATTADVAGAIADLLASVEGIRVYRAVLDTARPPCVILGQPTIDYTDGGTGFCSAAFDVPCTLVTARNNDRDAQAEMSRMLADAVNALAGDAPGVFCIEPQSARPVPVAVGGQELPGYLLLVRVRA